MRRADRYPCVDSRWSDCDPQLVLGLPLSLVAGRVPGGARPPPSAHGHQVPLLRDLFVRPHRRLPAEELPGQQDQAVDDQEDRGPDGLAEQDPEFVLEHEPDEPDRDRRQDDHPGEPLVGRLQLPSAGPRRRLEELAE